jgi:hypothetical protein
MDRVIRIAATLMCGHMALASCSGSGGAERATITGPSAVTRPSRGQSAWSRSGSLEIAFPPRNEALQFRQTLEALYRDTLRRGPDVSYVDLEGDVVWIQEYLRFRTNGCGHAEAQSRVMSEIDGAQNVASCGAESTAFPPRNEALDFRRALEQKYRDGLRRGAGQTFVDTEGDVVWTTEYFRYRTAGCSHQEAVSNVQVQIQGGAAPGLCDEPLAVIDAPATCIANQPCSFSGLRSVRAVRYEWDFAVGVSRVSPGSLTSRDPAPTFVYPRGLVVGRSQQAIDVRLVVTAANGKTHAAIATLNYVQP